MSDADAYLISCLYMGIDKIVDLAQKSFEECGDKYAESVICRLVDENNAELAQFVEMMLTQDPATWNCIMLGNLCYIATHHCDERIRNLAGGHANRFITLAVESRRVRGLQSIVHKMDRSKL